MWLKKVKNFGFMPISPLLFILEVYIASETGSASSVTSKKVFEMSESSRK